MNKAILLDLGSTLFKAAIPDEKGGWEFISVAAPALTSNGLYCEADSDQVLKQANLLFYKAKKKLSVSGPVTASIGIASQRSSFVLWEKESGTPVTRLISWQDRRAKGWCLNNPCKSTQIWERSYLPVLPYYAGPKLAVMLESNPALRNMANAGKIAFGTLETFIVSHWTGIFQTDQSMAARTLLFDVKTQNWAQDNMQIFGIPPGMLPKIMPTAGKALPLKQGDNVTCTVADQSASSSYVLNGRTDQVLVNLGTGGFITRLAKKVPPCFDGFLYSQWPYESKTYIQEGTINGLGPALNMFGRLNLNLSGDTGESFFCLPDVSGAGSPHWRPKTGMTFSDDLPHTIQDKCRAVYEGCIFRVAEIIGAMFKDALPSQILICGGNATDFIASGLASCLQTAVMRLNIDKATLMGVGNIMSKTMKTVYPKVTIVHPHPDGSYLPEKFVRWQAWLESILENMPKR